MPVQKLLFALLFTVACVGDATAQRVKSREEAEAVARTLQYREGEIILRDGLATLHVPEGFRFLDSADTDTMLVRMWGNPPGENPLGMLMSASGPFGHDAWAMVITYEEDGHVVDRDATTTDWNSLLQGMQEQARKENPDRAKKGYGTTELVGWAARPRYDRAAHKLFWAKELRFEGEGESTLNYNIRMLGRRGVLALNAIAGMSQLRQIEQEAPRVLSAIEFNPGNRYADFDPQSDRTANYGLAALVAGSVAAKPGIFGAIGQMLAGAKTFLIIMIAVIAVAILARGWLGRKESQA